MDDLINISSLIYEIRGQKVMLDFDLARMYGVETKQLKRSVRRNIKRFEGDDFMFELTHDEFLRCNFGTSSWGGSRYMPFAFTEMGVAMLKLMTTISLTYNERNELAKKTIDFLLSLGVFKVETYKSDTRNKTLKAIRDAKEKQNITVCDTFEDYLKAVSE